MLNIKLIGLEIRKLLFIPLVLIQTRRYDTMPFSFCVYVSESYVLRKSISSMIFSCDKTMLFVCTYLQSNHFVSVKDMRNK